MQRTNKSSSSRTAVLVVGGVSLVGMCAITLPFLLARAEVPGALVLVGRWIPAAGSLIALSFVRHDGGVADWWQLRPGGVRRLLVGTSAALAVTAAVAALGHGIARVSGVTGSAELPGPAQLVGVVLGTTLVASISTLGEEVAWRGHLRRLTRHRGFWVSSLGIGAFWASWHVPLHASYVSAGVMPTGVAAASTVALVALGPLWAALVERFGSIWPAVVAHAFPVTPFVLAGDLGRLGPWEPWALAAIWGLLNVTAAALIRPASPVESDPSAPEEAPDRGERPAGGRASLG